MKTEAPDWWHYSSSAWQKLVHTLYQSSQAGPRKTKTSQTGSDHFTQGSISPSPSQLYNKRSWTPLGGGVTNFSYRVKFGADFFFIQLLDQDKFIHLPNQSFVPVCKVISDNQNLMPWLATCLLDTDEIRIFEWVEAEATNVRYFDDRSFCEQLCSFLASLHNSIDTLPMLDIRSHLDNYYQLANQKSPERRFLHKKLYLHALDNLKSFSPSNTCHNDLSPGNILCSKTASSNQLYVVDWEYACLSDPLFDLAGVSVNFELEPHQEANLIKAYTKNRQTYFNSEKFYEMKVLYGLICELWSV
ncbi:phosphotransferase [Aliikangiella coralliicola]|uniref:Phosphotransferase n=1 Tax=Aliikangiella coralliicola TaxID=2592383 RepID=A0A545U7X9_9GAMM|nr:phosphotransferase [Aliikangiella coralliicola]TQV85569.1 phosphotransferase [Aliikangiella coralliicola]